MQLNLKILSLSFIFIIYSTYIISDEGRLGRDSKDFKYSGIGLNISKADSTDVGAYISIGLPGSLYIVAEKEFQDVDFGNETFEKEMNKARIGIHFGIGDLLGSISAGDIKVDIENIFDIYLELGIKSYDIDNIDYLVPDAGTEGNFFLDVSKEVEIGDIDPTCLSLDCPKPSVKLSKDTDTKFGASFTYNITKRNAVEFKVVPSDIFSTSFVLGYKFNF
jgi:hypothetical protein